MQYCDVIRFSCGRNIKRLRSAEPPSFVPPRYQSPVPPGRPCLSFSPLVLLPIEMRAVFAALAVLPVLALGMWITRGMLEPFQLNRSTAARPTNSYDPHHWA